MIFVPVFFFVFCFSFFAKVYAVNQMKLVANPLDKQPIPHKLDLRFGSESVYNDFNYSFFSPFLHRGRDLLN